MLDKIAAIIILASFVLLLLAIIGLPISASFPGRLFGLGISLAILDFVAKKLFVKKDNGKKKVASKN